MRIIGLFLCILGAVNFTLAQKLTEIKGYAPAYVGKQIDLNEIMDYISMRQTRIASTTVKEDSTFSFTFYLNETQKLYITSDNSRGNLFVQPGASYEILFPEKNKYDVYNPANNFVEIPLFNLDKSDVNYKILEFNRWTDEFVARYYTKNNADSKYFSARLDTFKISIENYYKADTLDRYVNYHRRFTMAKVDDLKFLGSRNKYEKFDFYLGGTPVYYQNEAYMTYVKSYYDKFLQRVDSKINNSVYLALLKSSPTAIYNALSKEYTLRSNRKLRELVMIYMLSQSFYDKEMPQTNIITVLDSLEQRALFSENSLIAKNVKFRLMELAQGLKAPNFVLQAPGETKTLESFKGKHLYLFFIDPNSETSIKEMKALLPIYERYKNEVQFVMLAKSSAFPDALSFQKLQNDLPWTIYKVDDNNSIYSNYQVARMPYYVLMDGFGYVVQAPALGPIPNGNYDTIDKVFFLIQKALKEGNGSDR